MGRIVSLVAASHTTVEISFAKKSMGPFQHVQVTQSLATLCKIDNEYFKYGFNSDTDEPCFASPRELENVLHELRHTVRWCCRKSASSCYIERHLISLTP